MALREIRRPRTQQPQGADVRLADWVGGRTLALTVGGNVPPAPLLYAGSGGTPQATPDGLALAAAAEISTPGDTQLLHSGGQQLTVLALVRVLSSTAGATCMFSGPSGAGSGDDLGIQRSGYVWQFNYRNDYAGPTVQQAWTDDGATARPIAGRTFLVIGRALSATDTRLTTLELTGKRRRDETVATTNTSALVFDEWGRATLGRDGHDQLLYGALITGWAMPDERIEALRANPWALFEPRRIWVPRAAAGGGSPSIGAPLVASAVSVSAPTFARWAVASVSALRVDSTTAVATPTVARRSVAAVSLAAISSTAIASAPTVARSAVASVSAAVATSVAEVPQPAILRQAVATITPATIAEGASVAAPAVSANGVVAVSAVRIASTSAVALPGVARVSVQTVQASRADPTASVQAPSVARRVVRQVQPGRVDSTAVFGVPAVARSRTAQITVAGVAGTSAVPRPSVSRIGSGAADPAEVWRYMLANGKSAEDTLLEIHALLTALAGGVNVERMNGAPVIGTGAAADPWRGLP